MQSKETNFKILEDSDGGKITLAEFYKEFLQFVKEVHKEFKKHGWTK